MTKIKQKNPVSKYSKESKSALSGRALRGRSLRGLKNGWQKK